MGRVRSIAWASERYLVEPLPQEVIEFVEANIDSVDQLEILRILAVKRDQEWSSTALAHEMQIPPQTIATHLEALDKRGLLSLSRGVDLIYRYGPQLPKLESQVNELLRVYNERPVTLIRMIYARANSALKSFADAFRIRKED